MLFLKKGSTPTKLQSLKAYLHQIWEPNSSWTLIPLADGFYDMHFDFENDMRKAWSGGRCTLDTGFLLLTPWKPDFDPYALQVWIRIYGLSLEYWHPHILFQIARGVGIPLQLNKAIREQTYGYLVLSLVQ